MFSSATASFSANPVSAESASSAPSAPAAPSRSQSAAAASSSSSSSSIYGIHPGVAMEQAVLSTLAERTGRSLAEWVELVKKSGPAGEKSRISWLRTEHRLGKSTARWIVERATGNSLPYDPERLVSKLFGEPGELSRATYDALVLTLLGLGSDVTVTPCKTVVPVRRRQVFAELRPATRGRVELGLSLGRSTVSGRLSSTAGLARRSGISHRLLLSGPAEVSDELREILDAAYRSSPR